MKAFSAIERNLFLFINSLIFRQIFQQRRYQTIIRNSLSEIAQERCLHGEERDEDGHEIDHENETQVK